MNGRRVIFRLRSTVVTVAALNLGAAAGLLVLWQLGAGLAAIGLIAYGLGMRHAFDIDHIAAIDNATRRLRAQGQRPAAVGLFFSLGHSTVVFALTAVMALAAGRFKPLDATLSHLGAVAANVGSALFLTLIGLLNLALLTRLHRQREAGEQLSTVSYRPFIRLSFARIDRSWKLYPLGMLFGLGFDTASEIAVLAMSVTAVQTGVLSSWEVMAFPLLFAAGMSLMDSVEGLLVLRLYDWAVDDRARTLRLNMLLTGLSVCIALGVAGIRWVQVLMPSASARAFTDWAGSGLLGVAATLVMVALWALAVWLRARRHAAADGARTLPSQDRV